MVYPNEYYQIIEELRIAKGVPVTELCQDVISERTYYRNLSSKGNIRYDILSRLSKRLGFTAEDLIHFAIFVRKGDPSVTRFMYRVHVKHFDDIEPIYTMVQNHQETSETYKLLIEAYLAKYAYIKQDISTTAYHQVLEALAKKGLSYGISDIFVASTLTLYLVEVPDQTLVEMDKLIHYFNTFEFRNNLLFYVFSVDLLLNQLMQATNTVNSRFIDALSHFGQAITFFPHKYFHMRYALYLAYEAKLKDDQLTLTNLLIKYLMHLNMIVGNPDYDEAIKQVHEVFAIDAFDFMQKEAVKRLKLSPFTIV